MCDNRWFGRRAVKMKRQEMDELDWLNHVPFAHAIDGIR